MALTASAVNAAYSDEPRVLYRYKPSVLPPTLLPRKLRSVSPHKPEQPWDKYWLYQEAFQSPAEEVLWLETLFRHHRRREPELLREDFCGTALLCAQWVFSSPPGYERRAIGVDISAEALAWGRRHNQSRLRALIVPARAAAWITW
jgi:hypothetical protein